MRKQLILWVYLISLILFNTFQSYSQVVANQPSAISDYEFTRKPSGVEIACVYKGLGEFVKVGDLVKVHFAGSTSEGKDFYSTIKQNKPATVVVGLGKLIAGLDEGLQELTVGSKAIFKIPASMGYGKQGYGTYVPPNADLVFLVEVIEILENPNPVVPFNIEGKDTITGKNELKYIYVRKTDTIQAETGDSVWVHYIGYLPDGKIFDTSYSDKVPFSFKLGDPQIIKGWNRGIAFMKEGEKLRFFIPWKMAYGKDGLLPKIPPKTDLTFDIELVQIKKK